MCNGPNTAGIEVAELQPMECVEITGTYRIVSFDLMAVEQIDSPSTLENEDGDQE